MEKETGWLETDEREEALAALEFLIEILAPLPGDTYRWKWVFVVMHNAVQAFMVLALRQSDGRGPIRDDVMFKILEALRLKTVPPVERLDSFPNLYRKIKITERMQKYGRSKPFVATSSQDYSMRKVHELRNEFLHFTPKGWALDLAGAVDICLDCLQIIGFLAEESGTIWWMHESEGKRFSFSLEKLRSQFQALTQTEAKP